MLKIEKQLHPSFEILGLLALSRNEESINQSLIEVIEEMGLDGREILSEKKFDIYRKYIKEFSKNKVSNETDDFFFENASSASFFASYYLAVMHHESIEYSNYPKDMDVSREILVDLANSLGKEAALKEEMSFDDILHFLLHSELSDSNKWKMISLVKDPQKYMLDLEKLIEANLPAYEKALKAIEPELSKLLEVYQEKMDTRKDNRFFRFLENMGNEASVFPTLCNCVSQIFSNGFAFYGLLTNNIIEIDEDIQSRKKRMLLKAKALSDKSKMEILFSLKEKPKYSLELSEELGLSPSTISHHTTHLLNAGLITIKKSDGRVRYRIDQTEFQNFLEELKRSFLTNSP